MTQPIQEPTTQRKLYSLGYGQEQLFRRPSPPGDAIPSMAAQFNAPYDFSTGYPQGFFDPTLTAFATNDATVFQDNSGQVEILQNGLYIWTMYGKFILNAAVLDEPLGTTRLFPGEATWMWGISVGFADQSQSRGYRSLEQGDLDAFFSLQYDWWMNQTALFPVSGGLPHQPVPIAQLKDALIPSGGAFVPSASINWNIARIGEGV